GSRACAEALYPPDQPAPGSQIHARQRDGKTRQPAPATQGVRRAPERKKGRPLATPSTTPSRVQLVGGLNPPCCCSTHDLWYSGSSIESAWRATLSGRNESIITASSSVWVAPMLASARPGCGPCGSPSGWWVMLPYSMPFRLMNSDEA